MVDLVQIGDVSRRSDILSIRHTARRPVPWLHVRPAVAVAQCAADVLAFLLAIALAELVSEGVVALIDPDVKVAVFHRLTAAVVAEIAALAIGMLFLLGVRGHYQRRMPLFSGLSDLLACGGIGLLLSAMLQFTSGAPDVWLLVGVACTLFPMSAVSLRWLSRIILACVGQWRIPLGGAGAGQVSHQSGVALRAFQKLGSAIVWRRLVRPTWRDAKATSDVLTAGVLLLVLVPVFAVIAVLVKCDGGPIFYAHTRIGAGGRRFGCMKFRSMSQDSDAILARILRDDPERAQEWAATQKLRDDPRVTRIGALLRKTSLDEIPQLLNVLLLDMSLVGPRPIVEKEMTHYGLNIEYYLKVRPGITGLWQVSGRSDTTYAQRVQLDSWYVNNWTPWEDFLIICKTVPAVLNRRGAV